MPKRESRKKGVNVNINLPKREEKMRCHCHHGGCFGCGYFLGFIGALIFYLQSGQGFIGFLKALVWPVFIVMKILGL